MVHRTLRAAVVAVLGVAMLAGGGFAGADKPSWAGGDHRHDRRHEDGSFRHHRDAPRGERHFEERHASIVRSFYGEEIGRGHCPPGLAKKRNGCMPPGQAKKWRVGQQLPRGVVVYDLPPRLVVELGAPPAGYKYVRVAADILMIAVGTSMVVDAVQDLGRLF